MNSAPFCSMPAGLRLPGPAGSHVVSKCKWGNNLQGFISLSITFYKISSGASKSYCLPQKVYQRKLILCGAARSIGKCGAIMRHGLRGTPKNHTCYRKADRLFAVVYAALISQMEGKDTTMVLWDISFIRGCSQDKIRRKKIK